MKRVTLKEQVYKYLKHEIISGRIKPGKRIIEEKISKELNVSRSPIREAVQLLEKDGLINVNFSKSVTVITPTVEDYINLFEVRAGVESMAAYYSAQRRSETELKKIGKSIKLMEKALIDDDISALLEANQNFHEHVLHSSHNPILVKMTLQLRGLNNLYRKSIIVGNPIYARKSYEDHANIYNLILNQDADNAANSMKEHITHDYKTFMRLLNEREKDI